MLHDPRLDGLRGIAILLVVVWHGGHRLPFEGFAGHLYRSAVDMGWSGVDLFFVLSGFLITRILLRTKEDPKYLRNFYARRTLRIFPAYYLWLFFILVLVPHIAFFDAEAASWTLSVSPLWFWLYASNLAMALHGSWLHPILSITWSLAIEEQFYLVWPWIVRAVTRRRLALVCVGCLLLAPLLRAALVLGGNWPLAVFVLTPCRFDTLAAGALVAVLSAEPGGAVRLLRVARALLPASAGALVVSIAAIQAGWVAPGARPELVYHPLMATLGYSLLALFYGSALVLVGFGAERRTRIFAFRPLRVFGRYSYAIYLTHTFVGGLALLAFEPLDQAGWSVALASYAIEWCAMLLVAMLSWYLLESHFLRLKRRFA